ncbi:MAG: hypothetical protein B7Z81_15035, partial [Acidocella sp. 20-61-6]
IRSLKTRDLPTALNLAEDLFYELRAEQKLGVDVRISGNLKFKDLWKRFYSAHETGLSVHRQRLHKFMPEKYFIPFFGDARVNDMPDAFVEQYWDWRIGFVKREPLIKATKVKHTKGVERRPSFDEAEWKQIYTYLREWVKEGLVLTPEERGGRLHRSGPNAMHRYQRELLPNYLLFVANSDLRPNEARQLCWQDLRIEKDTENRPALVVEVAPTTKTGARTVVCREGTSVSNRIQPCPPFCFQYCPPWR